MRYLLLPLIFSTSLVAISTCSLGADPPIIRESGVLYLADISDKPLKVKVLKDAPGFFTREMSRHLGTLRAGQEVEVQAIDNKIYRVRGMAQQGRIMAWVSTDYLEPIPEALLADLVKRAERQKEVDAFIARHEVAIGMTLEEVIQSLGRPENKTLRKDQHTSEQTWEYVRYKLIPQQTIATLPDGQRVISTVNIKVPTGKLSIRFEKDVVASLEQSEGTFFEESKVRVVPSPIVVYW